MRMETPYNPMGDFSFLFRFPSAVILLITFAIGYPFGCTWMTNLHFHCPPYSEMSDK